MWLGRIKKFSEARSPSAISLEKQRNNNSHLQAPERARLLRSDARRSRRAMCDLRFGWSCGRASLRCAVAAAFGGLLVSVRREDEASVAAAGAAHRPKPPHLNHTALILGHLGAALKYLSHSLCPLEALTPPSRPTFSGSHLQNPTKKGLLVGAGS